jgi:hypothetical protein
MHGKIPVVLENGRRASFPEIFEQQIFDERRGKKSEMRKCKNVIPK